MRPLITAAWLAAGIDMRLVARLHGGNVSAGDTPSGAAAFRLMLPGQMEKRVPSLGVMLLQCTPRHALLGTPNKRLDCR